MVKKALSTFLALLFLAAIYLGIRFIVAGNAIDALSKKLENAEKEVVASNEREGRLRSEKEEEIAVLRGEIDSLNFQIAGSMERANEASAQAKDREEENQRLREEVQPVIDANPKLKEYVSNLLIINQQKDIEIQSLRFALSDWGRKEAAYIKQIDALEDIAESWKRQYEDERALRISFSESFSVCKRRAKREKVLTLCAGIGGAILGAVVS